MDSSAPVPLEPLFSAIGFFSDITLSHITPIVGNILLFIGVTFALGALSSAETSFFSLTKNERKGLEEKEDTGSETVLSLLAKPKRLLATILWANLIFYALLILIGLSISRDFFILNNSQVNPYIGLSITLAVVILIRLLFGEVAPKFYATQNNLKVVRKSAWFLRLLNIFLSPITKPFLALASFIESKLEKYNRGALVEEIDQALDHVINQNKQTGVEERNILKGIVKFGNTSVSQIMRSRVDVVFIDTSLTFHALLETVRESGYSRIPVCNGDLDQTEGIIYAKDLLPYLDENDSYEWRHLIKTAMFVPESKKIDDLLEEFQHKRVHMAIVVDEYGGASGLVTLEDVLEEVIGEIKDEFDDLHEIDYKKIDNNNYIFEGKTGVIDVCKVLKIPIDTFEEFQGEADTIAGMLLEIKGELPEQDNEIEIKGYIFKILEMNATRIVKVKITIHEP